MLGSPRLEQPQGKEGGSPEEPVTCRPLGRFIPRYFILFVAMLNGIDSLILIFHF